MRWQTRQAHRQNRRGQDRQRNALITHCSEAAVPCRFLPIDDSATLVTEPSMKARLDANIVAVRIQPPSAAAEPGLADGGCAGRVLIVVKLERYTRRRSVSCPFG